MSSMLLPFRLAAVAGLALILPMTSASAAEDVAAKEPAATAAPVAAIARSAEAAPVAAKPVTAASATTEKAATDLGAARAAADKRVAATAPRVIRRAAPQRAFNCSGTWCGRQFVLMLGTSY